ncbi:MAG: Gfo/Idh/MocA family oxidoreductase [Pseudomonadota bacterium]
MKEIAIIGCGFVADLYMKSLEAFPEVRVAAAYDRDPQRLQAFCSHWNVPPHSTLAELLDPGPASRLILNLTNPDSHFEISQHCLDAGFHVYSEKPLAMTMEDARALYALAEDKNVMLASAPCSFLGETAQTLAHAIRKDLGGAPRLIYAELDDDFIPQAPYKQWISESGAPWPYEDEFNVGCTLEHAGYYLTWLIAIFGPIRTVVAASAEILPDKIGSGAMAPDYSTAVLYFHSGMVARLTCSIAAPHNHGLQVITDNGVLEVPAAWNNSAPVKFRRRFTLRRRLLNHPFAQRIRLSGPTHPKVKRTGAAAMNFALGPAEMLEAIEEERACRLSPDFALHLNEVTLAIQNAGETTGAQRMTTTCEKPEPMPWAT